MMLIVGLTGSIGMGKSTVAEMFRARGISVFDADAEVHRLYENEAVPLIEAAFPGTASSSTAHGPARVDRSRLAAALAQDKTGFHRLEAIVHPLVKAAEKSFLAKEASRSAPLAVLEIPLLFETGLDAKVDAVVVVSAPPDLQRERVLARPGMTAARLDDFLTRQLPDAEKCRRADFVVDTSKLLTETQAQVDAIMAKLEGIPALAYDRHWR